MQLERAGKTWANYGGYAFHFINELAGHKSNHTRDLFLHDARAGRLPSVSRLYGDGQPDLITGKRYFAHNGSDPGEREPIGLYWYEWRKAIPTQATEHDPGNGGVEWIRHIVDYGGRMGGGMQIAVADLDGNGNLDIVSGGKAGLFLAENLSTSKAIARKPH